MPKEGFLKVVAYKKPNITSSEKVKLVKTGNILYKKGDIQNAKKIFLSIGYTSGIIRIGDHYIEQGDYFEAYRMYVRAPAPEKISRMIKNMAAIIRNWVNE